RSRSFAGIGRYSGNPHRIRAHRAGRRYGRKTENNRIENHRQAGAETTAKRQQRTQRGAGVEYTAWPRRLDTRPAFNDISSIGKATPMTQTPNDTNTKSFYDFVGKVVDQTIAPKSGMVRFIDIIESDDNTRIQLYSNDAPSFLR